CPVSDTGPSSLGDEKEPDLGSGFCFFPQIIGDGEFPRRVTPKALRSAWWSVPFVTIYSIFAAPTCPIGARIEWMRGSGTLYRQRASRFWWMQYFHHGRRFRKSTGCDRIKDAQDVLRKTLVDIEQ